MNRRAFFLCNLSCPRRCIYCDQQAITGEIHIPEPREVESAIEQLKDAVEICYFGGSFTCLSLARQQAYLDVISKAPPGSQVRFSTHPLCFDKEVFSLLGNYPVSMIELGVSSLEDHVLDTCRRGYSGKEVLEVISLLLKKDFRVGVQVMIGLPGQTIESSLDDLEKLERVTGGKEITLRIYPCLVLKGTQLERMLVKGTYKPLSVQKAAEWAGIMIKKAQDLGFPVQRVGLQETASLSSSIVAGPHHPALGELARSEALVLVLLDLSAKGPWQIPSRQRSLLFGHNRYGLKILSESTGVCQEDIEKNILFC